MSELTKSVCDFCGREIDTSDNLRFVGAIEIPTWRKYIDRKGRSLKNAMWMTMCVDCRAAFRNSTKEHPASDTNVGRKTYAEDFCSKFPNTKIYEEEHRPWFCRKEIYEGKTGYCGGYSRGECCACWNEVMEGEDDNI